MALFGEKYGDWVRMVEVEDVSRELCGGTHTAATGEVGLFHVTSEGSSASNVRRIEAVTGPVAAEMFRERTERLHELATMLRVPESDVVHAVERLTKRVKELEKQPSGAPDRGNADELVGSAAKLGGARLVVEAVEALDAKALLALSDAVRQRLGEAVVVLGTAVDGRVHLVAQVAPELVSRGLNAGDIVRTAAQVAGGGGGGRDTMAQAGGRDPERLPDALAAARVEIEKILGAS
jgi:alanyl-tRNA synthetase